MEGLGSRLRGEIASQLHTFPHLHTATPRDDAERRRGDHARVGIDAEVKWLETVYGEFRAGDGMPEDMIAIAEACAGIRLPSALRTLYLREGRSPSLNANHGSSRR